MVKAVLATCDEVGEETLPLVVWKGEKERERERERAREREKEREKHTQAHALRVFSKGSFIMRG